MDWGKSDAGMPADRPSRSLGHGPSAIATSLLLGRRGALGGGAVLGAGLLAVGHAEAVEHPPDDVVAHARQVADAAAANPDDRGLLEGVPFAGDVRRDFLAVGEPHPRHLAERRVRLLRGHRLDLEADPALERAAFEHRRLGLVDHRPARLTDELVDRGHEWIVPFFPPGDLAGRP